MTKFQKIIYLVFVSCILYLVSSSAFAATLYFNPAEDEVVIGDVFQVEVRLNTEGKDANAVDVNLDFSPDLKFNDFSDGSSIISLWAERPKTENNKVSFSGLMPGGFRGDGLVLKLVLEAKNEGIGKVVFGADSQVLLNDGHGTAAPLKFSDSQFTISQKVQDSEPQILEIEDKEPPESFEPKAVRLNNIFDGKWFVVFSTQDKDSGMDYYEIFDNGEWVRAESPYVLKNQNFKGDLRVKAVDKAGNERIEKVASEDKPWYKNCFIWSIIILILIIVAVLNFKKIKEHRKLENTSG